MANNTIYFLHVSLPQHIRPLCITSFELSTWWFECFSRIQAILIRHTILYKMYDEDFSGSESANRYASENERKNKKKNRERTWNGIICVVSTIHGERPIYVWQAECRVQNDLCIILRMCARKWDMHTYKQWRNERDDFAAQKSSRPFLFSPKNLLVQMHWWYTRLSVRARARKREHLRARYYSMALCTSVVGTRSLKLV